MFELKTKGIVDTTLFDHSPHKKHVIIRPYHDDLDDCDVSGQYVMDVLED